MDHFSKCSIGSDNPVYLCVTVVTLSLNLNSSSHMHYGHSVIELLCIPHHHAGISFRENSSADSRCGFVTNSSNLVKNVAKLGNPSFVGSECK